MKLLLRCYTAISLILFSCTGNPDSANHFMDSFTFYASFDYGFEAEVANDDPNLYVSPSWSDCSEPEVLKTDNEHFSIRDNEGIFRSALWIDNSWNPVYFYKGAENIAYTNNL